MPKRGRDQSGDIPEAKRPRAGLNLDANLRANIANMAIACGRSMQRNRNMDWTTYARLSHQLVKFNFGIGAEDAIKCLGCHRMTPPVLITGDHIVPKSNQNALRAELAFKQDRLNQGIYMQAISGRVAQFRNTPSAAHIQTIRQYDDGLKYDLRNIQPLCWYCNSKKGDRDGVDLYPAHAKIPRRSHEAPF